MEMSVSWSASVLSGSPVVCSDASEASLTDSRSLFFGLRPRRFGVALESCVASGSSPNWDWAFWILSGFAFEVSGDDWFLGRRPRRRGASSGAFAERTIACSSRMR